MNEQEQPNQDKTDPAFESLEERLHRLESAIASMQDVRTIEERVAERVRQQPQADPPNVADKIQDGRQARPQEARLPSVQPDLPPSLAMVRRTWLILDMWADLVSIVRMFFDVRYHVGWFARMAVLVLVPAILTSQFWLPMAGFPFVGGVLDKIVTLFLAFFLYQALSRETIRYQSWRSTMQNQR